MECLAIDAHVIHLLVGARGDRFIGDVLERQRLVAAHLFVGGDQRDRADIDQTLVERVR